MITAAIVAGFVLLAVVMALTAMFNVLIQPTNDVYAGGRDPVVEEFVVETATTMYPGRLVQVGTNPNDVVVCAAGANPIGWLGYSHCNASYKPDTVDTIYEASDRVPVLRGGGFYIVGSLLNGVGAVTKGQQLIPAAGGEVTTAAALTIDSGSTAVLSSAANGALISGEIGDDQVVGTAAEAADSTSTAVDILILSKL